MVGFYIFPGAMVAAVTAAVQEANWRDGWDNLLSQFTYADLDIKGFSLFNESGGQGSAGSNPLGDTGDEIETGVKVMIGGISYFLRRDGSGYVDFSDSNGKTFLGVLDGFALQVLLAVNSIAQMNDINVQSRLNEVLNSKKVITIAIGQNNFDENTGLLTWDPTETSDIYVSIGSDYRYEGRKSGYKRDTDLELVHELLGHGYQYSKGILNHDRMEIWYDKNKNKICAAEKVEADASTMVTLAARASGRSFMWQPVYVEHVKDPKNIEEGSPKRYYYHLIPDGYLLTNENSQKSINYKRTY